MKTNIAIQPDTFLNRGLLPALLATALLSFGAASSAQADKGKDQTPDIFSPDARPYGRSYSQWSAAWWRWATAIPAANNPIADETGEDAALGQSGNVWFLAGNFGGTSERSVTVPPNKSLFFPIVNQLYLGFPCDDRNLPGCEADQAFEEANDIPALLSFISPSMDQASLACSIDGLPVRHLAEHRVQSSKIYSVTLPDENIFGLPEGPYHPCVDDGYFLMLAPLKAGRHTIHFVGANSDGSFALDVTYHLTVLRDRGHEDGDDHTSHSK